MKRLTLIIFLLVVVSGVVYSQSITVLGPNHANIFPNDGSINIVWTENGNVGRYVKIRLFDSSGNVKVADINNHFDSIVKNKFRWNISRGIKGGMYIVRVRTIDNMVMGDSEVFEIKPPVKKKLINLSNNSFQIEQPDSASVWYKNFQYNIVWKPNGSGADAVGVYLINYFKPVTIHEIRANGPNDLHEPWLIPNTISDGRYRIKVVNKDSNLVGISKIFKIKTKPVLKKTDQSIK